MKRQGDKIRTMGGAGYKLSIAIIFVLTAILLSVMLIVMPAIEQVDNSQPKVVSIEFPSGAIGLGDDLSKLHANVSYSDGTVVEVSLSDLIVDGLNRKSLGKQKVSLTYGGFEQVLSIEVKRADCVISYNASTGGRIEGETTQYVNIGGTGNTVIARPDVGYVFDKWNDGNPNMDRQDRGVSSNATYTATFKKAQFTVIFRYPDQTVAREQRVTYNEAPAFVPVHTAPEMQVYGYVFDSWSLPFEHVTSDMTIDPIFRKYATDVTVDVTRDFSGVALGTVNVPIEGYYPKDKLAIIRATPLTSRSFVGWQIKAYDGTWQTITAADVSRGDKIRAVEIGRVGNVISFTAERVGDTKEYELYFTPNADTELIEIKADFVFDESTITFINTMNTRPGNIERTVKLKNGDQIGPYLSEPQNIEQYFGFEFLGWFPENSDERVIFSDTFTQPTVLVARWRKNYYPVVFDFDMESVPVRTVYVLYQSTLSSAVSAPSYENPSPTPGIPVMVPQKEHYTFDGWYLVGDGNVLTNTVVDERFKVTKEVYVRAKFVPITHELTVVIDGAGSASRTISTQVGGSTEVVNESVPVGVNIIQEISIYSYKFVASEGYCIAYIRNQGNVTYYGNNVTQAEIQISYPTESRVIEVKFIPKTYIFTVNNGAPGESISVEYYETEGGVFVKKTRNETQFTFIAENKTPKTLYITPAPECYLDRVIVGSTVLEGFPATARTYTVNIDANLVVADTVVQIIYSPFVYSINLPEGLLNGAVTEARLSEGEYYSSPKSVSYGHNSSPAFLISANTDYYISGIRINGKIADMYAAEMFTAHNVDINGIRTAQPENSGDDRVTSMAIVFDYLSQSYNIEVTFSPLYYHISVSYGGTGTVVPDKTRAAYGEDVQAFAETGDGYYVHSYTLNGAETVLTGVSTSQPINIRNITADVSLYVLFSFKTHIITFEGSENAGVMTDGVLKTIPETYGIAHTMSGIYRILSNEGYYIYSISVNNVPQVIPNNVRDFALHIDNVTDNVRVSVKTMRIAYAVTVKVNDSSAGGVSLAGAGSFAPSATATVNHGSSAAFDVSAATGYEMSADGGTLAGGTLTVSNVNSSTTILVTLTKIIYQVTADAANGRITYSGTPTYGETIYIKAIADEGYKLAVLTVDGVPVDLEGINYENYVYSVTVTANVTVYAEFEAASLGARNTLSIIKIVPMTGGPVAMEEEITVSENATYALLIESPAGLYISMIELLAGAAASVIYEDAGSFLKTKTENVPGGFGGLRITYDIMPSTVSVVEDSSKGTTSIFIGDSAANLTETNTGRINNFVRAVITPVEGYEPYAIRLNGAERTFSFSSGAYIAEFLCTQDSMIFEVLYREKVLTVTGVVSIGDDTGSVSGQGSFIYGAETKIKVIPKAGYQLSNASINGNALNASQLNDLRLSKEYTVAAGSELSKTNITFSATFSPVIYNVYISAEGLGTTNTELIRQVAYGSTLEITLTAEENNFIDGIYVDGIWIEVNSSNLRNYVVNPATQRFTSGVYSLYVTRDINFNVIFKTNIYKVNLMPSVNGTTKVNLYSENSSEGASLNITQVEHGRAIQISMEAMTGCNISRLFINNVEINPSLYKSDNQNPNNNKKIIYIYRGAGGSGITTNLLIRVEYATNKYSFRFESVNESPNFKDYDLSAASFGTLSVNGYELSNSYYRNIPHGDDFLIYLSPVREKGYVITRITVTFTSPVTKTVVNYTPDVVGGASAVVNRTGAVVFFSELMREHMSGMICDIDLIRVYFTRETFEYNQVVESAASTGTISTRFYHPNDSTKTHVFGSSQPGGILLIGGKFEYGLGYNVTVVAATGYSRSAFIVDVNGLAEDKNNSVKANAFTGILQGNVTTRVTYTVNRYPLTFVFNVYDEFNSLYEIGGSEYANIRLYVNNVEYSLAQGARSIVISDCAYGSLIEFVLTPNYEERGYYISSFKIGSQYINAAKDSLDEYVYSGYFMPDNEVLSIAEFRICHYSIDISYQGNNYGLNTIVNEFGGLIPWGRNATLRLNTDAGYDLVSLMVTQGGITTDMKSLVQYNVLASDGQTIRDILPLNSVRSNVVVVASYQRKNFELDLYLHDLTKGNATLEIKGNLYENYSSYTPRVPNIRQEDIVRREMVYDIYEGRYVAQDVNYTYDVLRYSVMYYDKLTITLLPLEGYQVKDKNTLQMTLYRYVEENGVMVKKVLTDNFGNEYIYNVGTFFQNSAKPDELTVDLSAIAFTSTNIEIFADFELKTYNTQVTLSPGTLPGIGENLVNLQVWKNGAYVSTQAGPDGIVGTNDDYYVGYFDKIRISIDAYSGFSLEKLLINGGTVLTYAGSSGVQKTRTFTQAGDMFTYVTEAGETYVYSCVANKYNYTFELLVNDSLVHNLLLRELGIETVFKVNQYKVDVTIYDNKSGQNVHGKQGTQLSLAVMDIIAHNNPLVITPTLNEGYSVTRIMINGEEINMVNKNSQFNDSVNNYVSGLNVHDPDNDTIYIYYATSINLHTSSIRAWVYEVNIDGYSDIAGTTTVTYTPGPVLDNNIEKYEYFTSVRAEASAQSTYDKIYRFSHYEEQFNNSWSRVQNGERGITLSGDNQNILEYTIRTSSGVAGNRTFRAVYYRVLTIRVEVMPEYKYYEGSFTNNNLRYLQYLTVSAKIGDDFLIDQNPANTWIYESSATTGKIPYVESYLYYVDSGKILKLYSTDNVDKNISTEMGFYKYNGSLYDHQAGISNTGLIIQEDTTFYLIARNETLLSHSIETIENTSNTVGGTLTWTVLQRAAFTNNPVRTTGVISRGSMNTAKVGDKVEIMVTPTTNYRFTGLFLRNIDEDATQAAGELIFRDDGAAGASWTLIESSTQDILVENLTNGRVKFTIFVRENMIMKFQFYRTFSVSYEMDYQNVGNGPGTIEKLTAESQEPVTIQSGREIFDYGTFITLQVPETTENYQFVGWEVNGVNLYTLLETEYPTDYKRTFRFYQNSVIKNIGDGLELVDERGDVYTIRIVALFQPVLVMAVVDEFYFYDTPSGHWNSWQSSATIYANYYAYFNLAQSLAGQAAHGRYALMTDMTMTTLGAYQPSSVNSVINQTIPALAFNSDYTQGTVWSQLKQLVTATSGDPLWNSREVYSKTSYFRMLLEHQYSSNNWDDNVLYLNARLRTGVDLVQWEYYDWITGTFKAIGYSSLPVQGSGGEIDYNNKSSMDNYYINFAEYAATNEGRTIDWTKPFIIRPRYQKKVELVLNKKAYTTYYGDTTTAGNNAQNPTIHNSGGTNTRAEFNYFEVRQIIPYAANGYRFIDWYDGEEPIVLTTGIVNIEVGGVTVQENAWNVPLVFEYGAAEQNSVILQGRYIRQYVTTVETSNNSGGSYLANDAPRVNLKPNSVVNTSNAYTWQYTYTQAGNDANCWTINITADAGLEFVVDFNRANVGNQYGYMEYDSGTSAYTMGYHKKFDYQNSITGNLASDVIYEVSSSDVALDATEANHIGEIKGLKLSAVRDRVVKVVYESFGTLRFNNLTWYGSIRLGKNLSNAIRDRFPGYFSGSTNDYILLRDEYDYSSPNAPTAGAIDGIIEFTRIPIKKVDYTYSGENAEGYNFVPDGFNLANAIEVNPALIGISTHAGDNRTMSMNVAKFNSNNVSISKIVNLDYGSYDMFGLRYNNVRAGSAGNPYLIGARTTNKLTPTTPTTLSSTEAYKQLRNIDTFFYWNTTLAGIHFRLEADINLLTAQTTNPNEKKGWVPLCWKNKTYPTGNVNIGFDGSLNANGKILSNFQNGSDQHYKPTGANESATTTRYPYGQNYGYGLFSAIASGASISNLIFSDVKFSFGSETGVNDCVGALAGRILGENITISNVKSNNAVQMGTIRSYGGFLAGRVIGSGSLPITIYNGAGYNLNTNITITGTRNLGGYIGSINGANVIVRDITRSGGTLNMTSGSSNIGGLFGEVVGAKIRNCSITGGTVTVGKINNLTVVGGVIAYVAAGAVIENVSMKTSATVLGDPSANIGVVIGQSDDATVTIDNCTFTGTQTVRGKNIGGIVGYNVGKIINTDINSGSAFMYVQLYAISEASIGLIAGVNTNTGYITDSGVYNSSRNPAQTFAMTDTNIYVYNENRYNMITIGHSNWATDARSENDTGNLYVGGIVGDNSGKVFNSYTVRTKILVSNNRTAKYSLLVGGIAGRNNLKFITNNRGISSCFTERNVFFVANVMRAWVHDGSDDKDKIGGIGMGGIAGGTITGNGNYTAAVRYCYAVGNVMDMSSQAFGDEFEEYGGGFLAGDPKKRDNPNEYATIRLYPAALVGGNYTLNGSEDKTRETSYVSNSWAAGAITMSGGKVSSITAFDTYHASKFVSGFENYTFVNTGYMFNDCNASDTANQRRKVFVDMPFSISVGADSGFTYGTPYCDNASLAYSDSGNVNKYTYLLRTADDGNFALRYQYFDEVFWTTDYYYGNQAFYWDSSNNYIGDSYGLPTIADLTNPAKDWIVKNQTNYPNA